MKILLIEDTQIHINAARKQLIDHEITIVSGLDQALESLEKETFDVLLTDVMIPKGGSRCMSEEGELLARKQGPMPYGPIIALHALQAGIKRVGILTSGNHHDDPVVFAFDMLNGFTAGDVKVTISNWLDILVDLSTLEPVEKDWNSEEFRNRYDAGELDYIKDWATLLARLLQD